MICPLFKNINRHSFARRFPTSASLLLLLFTLVLLFPPPFKFFVFMIGGRRSLVFSCLVRRLACLELTNILRHGSILIARRQFSLPTRFPTVRLCHLHFFLATQLVPSDAHFLLVLFARSRHINRIVIEHGPEYPRIKTILIFGYIEMHPLILKPDENKLLGVRLTELIQRVLR